MEKLVSVVIPSHGGGKFIQRAVDSALGQTYKNIEVIVVDDNGIGTEAQLLTASNMEKYKDNERVKYVCHEVNKKGSAARNTGVNNSKGEYIALLDDDDMFYPDNVENHVKIMESLPDDYALTYCDHDAYRGDKLFRTVHYDKSGSLFYEVMRHMVTIGSPSMMVKRSVWDELNGFDESFVRHQDWEFTARVAFYYKVKATGHMGFRQYFEDRHNHRDPDTAKKYREHYLERLSSYIDKLPKKQQKDIRIYNRLGVAFEYFRFRGFKAFWKEYRSIKPGYRGVKFIFKKVFSVFSRKLKGQKINMHNAE